MEYFIILILLFLVTLFLETTFKVHLYNSIKERILIPIIFLVIGTIWDSFAVYLGHWSFDYSKMIGIKIGLLPLEEYLFFLIVPYFILTFYRVIINKMEKKSKKNKNIK